MKMKAIAAAVLATSASLAAAHEAPVSAGQARERQFNRQEVLALTKVQGGGGPLDAGGAGTQPGPMDEMSDAERAKIWVDLRASMAKLAAEGKLAPAKASRPSLSWPIRAASGYPGYGVYAISNFVDQNPAYPNQVRDWNCGSRSYDTDSGYNHKGIDIYLAPDIWNLMEAKQAEVVAAAPGTIIQKYDGNSDRNCTFNSKQWNAVYVRHDDGSVAWYGHLKNGSLTSKANGERVEAGEFLGNVGSSGNSTGPHLHFEVYNAAGALVDTYQGACNTMNADSWWAQQPSYYESQVLYLTTASGGPVTRTCGSDGTLSDPGKMNAKTVFAPGDTVYFLTYYRDQLSGQQSQYKVYKPDGSLWKSWTGSSSATFYSGSYWYWSYALESGAPAGEWTFEVSYEGKTYSNKFMVQSGLGTNHTGIWWNPNESGWGINFAQQNNQLFAAMYTYNNARQPLWLVTVATQQGDGSFSGSLFEYTGGPFNASPWGSVQANNVGTMTVRFSGATSGTLDYTYNGVSLSKPIQTFSFGSSQPSCQASFGSRALAVNYQDTWWNASESGWGLTLAHQGDTLFAAMFNYDTDRTPLWLLAGSMTRQSDGGYSGDLTKYTGTPFNASPFGIESSTKVGTMNLVFTGGEKGKLSYTVNGTAVSKDITRFPLSTPSVVCR